MAGPAASVLVAMVAPYPTWRELLAPFTSDWHDDLCYVQDMTPFSGSYSAEPRPFVGRAVAIRHDPEKEYFNATRFDEIMRVTRRKFTHSIEVAAMCNRPEDHRVLGELVAALAEMYDGWVDFDSLDAPVSELGMQRCCWHEDGCEYWTVLGDPAAARRWLRHPLFRMLK